MAFRRSRNMPSHFKSEKVAYKLIHKIPKINPLNNHIKVHCILIYAYINSLLNLWYKCRLQVFKVPKIEKYNNT